MRKLIVFISFVTLCASCDFFKKDEPSGVIATIGDSYLTNEDVLKILPAQYTKADSLIIVNNYINNWATDRLLMENARKNIPLQEQEQLDNLVNKYKIELYSQAYKEELTKQNLDTVLSDFAIVKYYKERKEEFKLNEDLVQLRYLQLDPNHASMTQIQELFKKGNTQSLQKLDSLSLGFKSFFLNDTIWIKKKDVYNRILPINPSNEGLYIKERKYSKLEDSLSVYLVQFNNVLRRGENAPLSYIKPTIKQVLLNKRKLNYIKKLEKDLLNDAIQSEKLKIKS